MNTRRDYTIGWGDWTLELGRKTCVMGVVNVTPDSFSDGGRFFDTDRAVVHGLQLAQEGAHILDIGGESTRPNADEVAVEEEIARVVPVIEALANKVRIPISIDTTKATVARRALAAGAAIINDVGALRLDPQMVEVAAEYGVPVMLMHMRGTPRTMQKDPHYGNLLVDIKDFLANAIDRAVAGGICRSHIIVDPGIGFGKTVAHNLSLIKHIGTLKSLDAPILIGASRKSFIQKILNRTMQAPLRPDLDVVETGSQAAVAAAVLNGAHIVRVHDVKNSVVTASIIDAIQCTE